MSIVKPPEQISAIELTELGFQMIDESGRKRRSALLRQFREAQRAVAAGKTLGQIISAKPANSTS